MKLGRRDFLKVSALAAAITSLGAAKPPTVETHNGIPYRVLGKTGEKVSLICIGGSHIGNEGLSDEDSIKIMRTAVDEGVNFFDNAYIYKNGRSEELMGKAMLDGYRDKVFLMTKQYTRERDGESVLPQLEESLTRLKTDVIDLYQVHMLHEDGHARLCYENKVMEEMIKAKEQGKIRYIGFTGHTNPDYHVEMLEGGFNFDTTQMPTNPMDALHASSYENTLFPMCLERNMGIIGMKSLGGNANVVNDGTLTAKECIHYAMNLPIASLVVGMDTIEHLHENLEYTRTFEPLEEAGLREIFAKCNAANVRDGRYEYYKNIATA